MGTFSGAATLLFSYLFPCKWRLTLKGKITPLSLESRPRFGRALSPNDTTESQIVPFVKMAKKHGDSSVFSRQFYKGKKTLTNCHFSS